MMTPSGVEIWDRGLVQSARFLLNRSEPNRQGWTFSQWIQVGGRPNLTFRHVDGRVCCLVAEKVAEKVSYIAMA